MCVATSRQKGPNVTALRGAFKPIGTPSSHRENMKQRVERYTCEASRLYSAIVEGGDVAARERHAHQFRRIQQACPAAAAILREWLKTREHYLRIEQIPDTDDGF